MRSDLCLKKKQSKKLSSQADINMIKKLKSGKYRLYSRKKNSETGKRKNLGTFETKEKALKHEREIQYFKRHG